MRFHAAAASALADQGVDTIFGVLGDGNLYLIESFTSTTGGRFVSFSHEAGAVLAAAGYSKTSRGVGVACVTHGPGLTNILTALINSVRDRNQMLVIAGDTPTLDHESFQDIPQRSFVDPTGAGFVQARSPHTIADDIRVAMQRTISENRPVVLNVPRDYNSVEVEHRSAPSLPVTPRAVPASDEALDAAVGILASAQRPVLLAGKGATSPEARAAILALARRVGAPVATTLQARDLFRGEPHDLGVCGTLSHDVAIDVVAKADCIVAFGAALNEWTTASGELVAGKRLIQVDLAPEAIHRWTTVHAGVVGDTAMVAKQMLAWLDEAEIEPSGYADEALRDRLRAVESETATKIAPGDAIDLAGALDEIDRQFPGDRTLVVDSGRFVQEAFRRLHVRDPGAYVHTIRFGSIGLGMGTAIGAYFGRHDRPVLLACGDGGFMLGGLAEFSTAVRYGVDVVVVVFNDGAYGAEHLLLRNRGLDPGITTFDWPDFAPVAIALGGQGFTVRTGADLRHALAAISERKVPTLIDVKLDPDHVPGHERSPGLTS